jgi:outer membrane receptor protein involved in Fe transport
VVDAKGTLDPIPASGNVTGTGGIFTYKTFSHVGYSWNGLSTSLGWLHLPSIRAAAASTNPTTTIQGAPAYDLLYLSAGYSFDKYSVRVGVDNLLDKDPPVTQSNPGVTTASNTTVPGDYDVLGRRYYIGVKASF